MRNTFVALTCLMVAAHCSHALAHDEDSRVAVELESAASVSAGAVELRFQLIDLKLKKVLEAQDINISHEKKVHLFLFDPALKEFRHIHPEYDGTAWKVSTDLGVNGEYWVWAQGELASDSEEFAGSARLRVTCGTSANTTPPVLPELREGTDGISGIRLSRAPLTAGQEAMLMLEFYRTDGTAPVITPYLGAMAHVVATPADGDSLLHVHPMQHGPHFMIHTKFDDAGGHRLWVQFIDGGVLRTVALSVVVQPAKEE